MKFNCCLAGQRNFTFSLCINFVVTQLSLFRNRSDKIGELKGRLLFEFIETFVETFVDNFVMRTRRSRMDSLDIIQGYYPAIVGLE